ncbi:cytochrome P450 [Salinarimonas chemoclinalis]|uniref:cytochrome P450 n=1 Tax=Salinarimonas chemoclinalis TaxID=3241599 RepID=UPI003559230B
MSLARLPPFPGVIAHHRPVDATGDHGAAFRRATHERGEDASSYFEAAGVTAFARANGGLCTFDFDGRLALYQATNVPLVSDEDLGPSIEANAGLFGAFMGALPAGDPRRPSKRAAVERSLGSARFVHALEASLAAAIRARLRRSVGREVPVDAFALDLVAHVESVVPGVLDMRRRPLSEFLVCPEFGAVARDFFEIASAALSNVDPRAIADADHIVAFTRRCLRDNFETIAAAPDTNLVRAQLAAIGIPFTRESIERLEPDVCKEIGTVIVAAYDTTALGLTWTLAYLAGAPAVAQELHRREIAGDPRPLAERVVLEALRLGGSNPTALWRRVARPTRIVVSGGEATVPEGAMLWLDRRAANRDPTLLAAPDTFDTAHIDAFARTATEPFTALISRGRYEINSFSMVNTVRNPRKCPGRVFSVAVQALVLREMFGSYRVTLSGADTRLAGRSAMPRPRSAGTLLLSARTATDARATSTSAVFDDRSHQGDTA